MKPMSDEEKDRILKQYPNATAADLENYERLRSQRFEVDPTRPLLFGEESIDEQIAQMHERIFGSRPDGK